MTEEKKEKEEMHESKEHEHKEDVKEEHHEIKHEEHNPKKNIRWGRILAIGLIIAVIVLIILFATNVIQIKKSTLITNVNVSYTLSADNVEAMSSQGVYEQDSIDSSLGLVSDKLSKEIATMSEGEEKTITLKPEEAFGVYDDSKLEIINRTTTIEKTKEMNRTFEVTLDQFKEAFNEVPVKDKIYGPETEMIRWKVVSSDEATNKVVLSREGTIGAEESYYPPYISLYIKSITPDKLTLALKLSQENAEMDSEMGQTKIKLYSDATNIYLKLEPVLNDEFDLDGTKIVKDFNETAIILDGNNKYAGREIIVKIKLNKREIIKTEAKELKKIPNAPTLQFFVMSYCPYGTQIEKAILPVWKEFQDKANIELRFVSYTMHGQKEDDENYRQICIREEQSDKLIVYVECFLEAGEGTEDACMTKAKVDKTKVESCMKSKAATYFEVDKQLNTEYGVQGSPTVVLDGKEVSIARNPEAIKTAICNAFTGNKPSECSKTYSSESPSAGFGYSTTSSSTSASCG